MKKYDYTIYIGRSDKQHEFCSMTVGRTRRPIEDRQVEKGFNTIFTFTKRMTEADSKSLEGHAHTIADKYYDRAFVKGGKTQRKGRTPNRTDEWWYAKPSKAFVALMIQAIHNAHIKRFNIDMTRHPYYKGAVPALKRSTK